MKFNVILLNTIITTMAIFIGVAQVEAAIPRIHKAIEEGDLTKVQDEIEKNGVGVNEKDAGGSTPLHNAVWCKQKEILVYLLQVPGININDINSFYVTALGLAVLGDNKDLVELLLKVPNIEYEEEMNMVRSDKVRELFQAHVENEAFKPRGMKTKSAASRYEGSN